MRCMNAPMLRAVLHLIDPIVSIELSDARGPIMGDIGWHIRSLELRLLPFAPRR